MTRTVVIDAHVILWLLEDNAKLSEPAAEALADAEARLVLPVIALAEVCWACRKGKSSVTIARLRKALVADPRLVIAPLDEEVVFAAQELSVELEMHDSIIVATAARELRRDPRTVLLSSDSQIRNAQIVPVIW